MNLSSLVLCHITRLTFSTSSLGDVFSAASALTTAWRLDISRAAGIPLPDTSAMQSPSRLAPNLKTQAGRFNTELPGVLRVEPRPTEFHCLTSNNAADGSSNEKPIQNIETNV